MRIARFLVIIVPLTETVIITVIIVGTLASIRIIQVLPGSAVYQANLVFMICIGLLAFHILTFAGVVSRQRIYRRVGHY